MRAEMFHLMQFTETKLRSVIAPTDWYCHGYD